MKKLLTLALATTLLTPAAYTFADDEVTPLQLKVMQTRKFMKPSLEVSKAAAEDAESIGATMCVNQIAILQLRSQDNINKKPGDVACMLRPKISVFSHGTDAITKITYEITPNPDDTETTVRMKILVNWKEPKPVTDPEVYAKRFKNIGDLIFIEAIPLSPAVQN